jgi:DNA-binding CsgD family transcriptional regulator
MKSPLFPRLSEESLDELIGEIYEAALTPERWDRVVRLGTDMFDAVGSSISTPLVFGSAAAPVWATTADPGFIAEYVAHYADKDFVATELLRRMPGEDWVFTLDDLAPREVYEAAPIYRDLLVPRGATQYVAVAAGANDPRVCCFGIYGGGWTDEHQQVVKAVMHRLRPHFVRAMRIHWHLSKARQSESTAKLTLDMFQSGVAWLAAGGEVLYANRELNRLIDLRDGLELVGDKLRASDPRAARQLVQAVKEAEGGKEISVLIERPSGAPPLRMSLVPVPLQPSAFRVPQAAAIALVSDSTVSATQAVRAFAQLYGLSPAETTVTEELLAGSDAKSIAAKLGTALSTVRSQIKSILAKSGHSRQADVILAILSMPKVRQADG